MISGSRYSPGVRSGELLLPEFQMDQYSREDFERVPTRLGHMYRYKDAPTPYQFPGFNEPEPLVSDDILDEWDYEFDKLHSTLVNSIRRQGMQIIVIECDDEEFLYGVLCSVLALLGESESDWLIEHQFDTMFVVRHLDTMDLEV